MIEPHSIRDFDSLAVELLTGEQPFRSRVTLLPALGPVIGFGTPLLARNGGQYRLRPDLERVFGGVHRFALRERRALEGLARHLSRGPAAGPLAADWAAPLSELSIAAADARRIAFLAAEPLLQERLPGDVRRRFDRSRELAALFGLVAQAPAVLGREAIAALRSTDLEARPRAWWTIGFAPLPERIVGLGAQALQAMRLRAATLFGLFDGESQLNVQQREMGSVDMTGPATREEAARVQAFLTLRLDEAAALLRAAAYSPRALEAALDPLRVLAGQARLGLQAAPLQMRRAPASLRERALGAVTLSGQRPRQIG